MYTWIAFVPSNPTLRSELTDAQDIYEAMDAFYEFGYAELFDKGYRGKEFGIVSNDPLSVPLLFNFGG